MIWQNPWALLGVAALALPILIHLLGRGRARVLRFPSLRFLAASRLLPTRRTRLHDPLLLAVRLAILAVAVAALAQPLWLSAGRARARNGALARVVIVDTSISMRRSSISGGRAVDAARHAARTLADSASPSMIIESAMPGAMIAGAAAWLARQPSRTQVVILSDFQPGTVSDADLQAVPKTVGIRLVRTAVVPGSDTTETRMRGGDADIVARSTFTAAATTTEWSATPHAAAGSVVQLLAGESERMAAGAAERAAQSIGRPASVDSTHVVAIVYPSYGQRAALMNGAAPTPAVWMTDVELRLRTDPQLASAAATVPRGGDSLANARTVIARAADGRPLIVAAQDGGPSGERLLLFSAIDAGSLTSAALIAAVNRALSTAPPIAELEPGVMTDSELARWQRAPSAEAPRRTATGGEGESDGRWLWIVVIALMILETVVRRTKVPAIDATADRVLHDRVA